MKKMLMKNRNRYALNRCIYLINYDNESGERGITSNEAGVRLSRVNAINSGVHISDVTTYTLNAE